MASAPIEGIVLAKDKVFRASIIFFPLTSRLFMIEAMWDNRRNHRHPFRVDCDRLGAGRLRFVLDPRIILRVIFNYHVTSEFALPEHAPDSI